MTTKRARHTLNAAATISMIILLTACSHPGAEKWTDAKTPPPGYVFSNGMAPSSNGPPPSWYARHFNRERGLGEAIKQNRRALWERKSGTFAYYRGGRFFAQYHPWKHYLQIRTDEKGDHNISCHWDSNAVLTMSEVGGGKPPAGSQATCKKLLDELEKDVAPAGFVAKNSPSPN